MSSASRPSEAVVNPTRSAKSTETRRRSETGSCLGFSWSGACEGVTRELVTAPHSEQNFAPAARGAEHDAHARASVAPHSEQNFAPGAFSVPQASQCMVPTCTSLGSPNGHVSFTTLQMASRKSYNREMDVGIRELRAGLSRYVAQVKQGEEIVVTEHGKPVARLVPMNGERKIDRLIREGVVIPARSRTGWLPDELIPVKGSVSEIVIEQRR